MANAHTGFEYIDLIGVPFEYGGRGPEIFDCYGLLMETMRRQGIEIPDQKSTNDLGRILARFAAGIQSWEPCEPAPGVAVALLIPDKQGNYGVRHCGTVLTHDRFIHTWEKSGGVAIERLDTWRRANRIAGFYRYAR